MNGGLREVNLELGRPVVDKALSRLKLELRSSRKMGVSVLKIIHGYGSSGTGGKIRLATRRYLSSLQSRGEIKGLIPGEQFSIFDETTRRAFLSCDALRQDHDLERHNNGVTFILLA